MGYESDRISDIVGLRAIAKRSVGIAFRVLWVLRAIASTKNGIILLFSRIILMEIQELKAIIKESIREVLREERMLLCQVLIPYVSDEEQEEKEIKMQIAVKPDQEKYILEKLQQGKYKSIDELLSIAFQLLEQHEEKEKQLSELRRKIAEGTEQIRQGEVIEGELVFQQLPQKLKYD